MDVMTFMGRNKFAGVKCDECGRTGHIHTSKGAKGGLCECGRMVPAPYKPRGITRRRFWEWFGRLANALGIYAFVSGQLEIFKPQPRVVNIPVQVASTLTFKAAPQVIELGGIPSGFSAGEPIFKVDQFR